MKSVWFGLGVFLATWSVLTAHADSFTVLKPMESAAMEPTVPKGSRVHLNVDAYAREGPRRWDIVAYRRPTDRLLAIHRVVGLPGERLTYTRDKKLLIDGQSVPLTELPSLPVPKQPSGFLTYVEALGAEQHFVKIDPKTPPVMSVGVTSQVDHAACTFSNEGFDCTIPSERYFLMGDNRDWALDSRYVGFVHRDDIAARAERWLSEDRNEYKSWNRSSGVK